jgi:hypothetical protein
VTPAAGTLARSLSSVQTVWVWSFATVDVVSIPLHGGVASLLDDPQAAATGIARSVTVVAERNSRRVCMASSVRDVRQAEIPRDEDTTVAASARARSGHARVPHRQDCLPATSVPQRAPGAARHRNVEIAADLLRIHARGSNPKEHHAFECSSRFSIDQPDLTTLCRMQHREATPESEEDRHSDAAQARVLGAALPRRPCPKRR